MKCVNFLATISLNLLLTLCASNLVFIVGVQASKNIFKCEVIAMLLHYFHLSTAIWGLNHTFAIYDYITNDNIPILKYNNLLAYGGSAVLVLVCFGFGCLSKIEAADLESERVIVLMIFQLSFLIFYRCWLHWEGMLTPKARNKFFCLRRKVGRLGKYFKTIA